jgi:hypothetical protein
LPTKDLTPCAFHTSFRPYVALQDLIIPLEIQADDGPITRSVGNFCYFFLWLKFSASVFAF